MAFTATRIADTFGVSPFTANLALLVLRGRINVLGHPRRFPRTCRWAQSCYHTPSWHHAETKLKALDELLGTYGTEPINAEGAYVSRYWLDCIGVYLNTGDTYATTLVYDTEGDRWKLTSWGDFLEAYEAANAVGADG